MDELQLQGASQVTPGCRAEWLVCMVAAPTDWEPGHLAEEADGLLGAEELFATICVLT